jgi:Ca-activated chloride channel homolog
MRHLFLILGLLFAVIALHAQQERKFIRKGNELYDIKKYEEAEIQYRKSLEKNPSSFEATFNIANALYKKEKYDEAAQQYFALTTKASNKNDLSKLYYNIGNALLQSGKIDDSIEAYKQALRNNPADLEAKYNLSVALKMKQQGQNQENKEQDQQDKQDKDKQDQQNQQQNEQQKQDQKQDQQQQQQDQQEQDKKEGQQGKKEQMISREEAERILQALENDEKQIQEMVKKKMQQPQQSKTMKDW